MTNLTQLLDYMVETHGLYLEEDYDLGETETDEEIFKIVSAKREELEATTYQEIKDSFTNGQKQQMIEQILDYGVALFLYAIQEDTEINDKTRFDMLYHYTLMSSDL